MIKRSTYGLVLLVILSLTVATSQASNSTIWEKLQGKSAKGYVLLLRHALAPGVGDPENFRLGDCSTQRNLSPEGRMDAVDLGMLIRERKVTIYQVESSRWCRATETAKLLDLGEVKPNKNLDSLFEEAETVNHPQTRKIRKQIVEHRERRGLLILVGHYVNIAALTGVGVNSGEGIVVRANRRGNLKVYGSTSDLGK